jgi:hypothetical protein
MTSVWGLSPQDIQGHRIAAHVTASKFIEGSISSAEIVPGRTCLTCVGAPQAPKAQYSSEKNDSTQRPVAGRTAGS